jgi:hypothetical protein
MVIALATVIRDETIVGVAELARLAGEKAFQAKSFCVFP